MNEESYRHKDKRISSIFETSILFYLGWVCFAVSIIFIGLLTAVIGDVASMFGCTIGLKDTVTAITLVALGTSVPGNA